jgi:O-antigen ligase
MRAVKSGIDIEQILFLGFCLTFFLIPLGTSPFLIAGFLTLAVWVCSGRFLIESRAWLKMPWVAPLLAFTALHWIGLLYTADPAAGLRFASKTHYWLFAFAIASIPFARYSPKTFLDSFLAGLSLAAVLHIAINAGAINAPQRYAASFINPITYIMLLTFGVLILSFYFGKSNSQNRKILYGGAILLYLASISLFTGAPGRTALLSLVLSTPLIVYNLLGQRSLPKVFGAAAITLALLFTTPVVRSSISDAAAQVKAYYDGSPDSSVGLRLHMWNGAFRIFMDNPVMGVGTGGYQMAMAEYASPGLAPGTVLIQPHNSFLYMAVSFGAAGLVSIAWLLMQFIRAGWSHKEHITGFSILAFGVVVLGASLTDTQIIQVHTGMLFAMLTGLQTALGRAEGRESENEDKRLYIHKKCA